MILKPKYNFLKPFKTNTLKRYGRNFDGGYLVCENAIKSIDNAITLGVGDDISFEKDIEAKKKINKLFLYDYTINNYFFLRIIFKYLRRFLTFRSKLSNLIYSITNYFDFINFIKKDNVFLYKKKVVRKKKNKNETDLNQIFSNLSGNNNILKIDIEGSEYLIVNDILKNCKRINTLIIEFHWINKNKNRFINSIKKLKQKFDIIHLHANNYRPLKTNEDLFDVIEITMVNKKINKFRSEYRFNFPVKGLDCECFPNHQKIRFSFAK
jgi:hypothetical protein